MVNQILKTIDDINNVILESEYDVICSLFDSYDKASIIAEEYIGNDIEQFSIFTESWILESKKDSEDSSNEDESKPKFKFRQTDENGKKENFFKSLFMLIPRLIKLAQEVHANKLEKKKLKRMSKRAKKMNTDLSKMDPGEQELFNAIINQPCNNKKQMKKFIRKGIRSYKFRRFLFRLGLKVGGGAIVVGGIAYTLNTKGEIIEQKVEEFKGEIKKRVDEAIDDAILAPMRNVGNEATEKIQDAAEQAVQKISNIAEKVENIMKKVIDFIKKAFQNIQKFFRVNLFNYDKAGDQGDILCKIDVKTGSLKVTLNLEQWEEWLSKSRDFVVNAAKFISHEVKEGKVFKNDANKRTGAIVDFQKDYDNAKIFKGDDAASAVKRYHSSLNEIFDKTKLLKTYEPISQFTDMAEKISDKMASICSVAKTLSDKYEKIIQNTQTESKWTAAEQNVFQTLRGILDTQIQLTNAIDAVNEYISGVDEMTHVMLDE